MSTVVTTLTSPLGPAQCRKTILRWRNSGSDHESENIGLPSLAAVTIPDRDGVRVRTADVGALMVPLTWLHASFAPGPEGGSLVKLRVQPSNAIYFVPIVPGMLAVAGLVATLSGGGALALLLTLLLAAVATLSFTAVRGRARREGRALIRHTTALLSAVIVTGRSGELTKPREHSPSSPASGGSHPDPESVRVVTSAVSTAQSQPQPRRKGRKPTGTAKPTSKTPPVAKDIAPGESIETPRTLAGGLTTTALVLAGEDETRLGSMTQTRLRLQVDRPDADPYEVDTVVLFTTAEERMAVRIGERISVQYLPDNPNKVVLTPIAHMS